MTVPQLTLHQPSLIGLCAITDAVNDMALASGEFRGAIFTRREVVDFILDLVGYVASEPLQEMSLLEPSFGEGDFLLPVIERLLTAWNNAATQSKSRGSIDHCIRAVELHRDTYSRTRSKVLNTLIANGVELGEAERLVDLWLIQADFLLTELPARFEFVIGNPPYVRQELIAAPLLSEYRRRYSTLFDRADLYIPFVERSLALLCEGGQLGLICSDRWTKNRYGGPLRALVANQYHLRAYVDMVDTPAFNTEVIAYPAITVIEKAPSGPTLVAKRPEIEKRYLRTLADDLRRNAKVLPSGIHRIDCVTNGEEPWVFHASDATNLVRRIESLYPTIEEAGCKVGIGVATGADRAYIGKFDELKVEDDRKVPVAMTRDITSGHVVWRGYGVINPYSEEGPLVDLTEYPRLAAYLEKNREAIIGRYIAKKDPSRWYRTIDRITPSLTMRPKLLIPDIKGEAQVVYEPGRLYPHHNLYYVVSDGWELRALQAVLLSDLTRLFVATYSTKMKGGFLRFQAQYLRRIRIPNWGSVSIAMRAALADAAIQLDLDACNAVVAELYQLTKEERAVLAAA